LLCVFILLALKERNTRTESGTMFGNILWEVASAGSCNREAVG
jgi:hypothetical protein